MLKKTRRIFPIKRKSYWSLFETIVFMSMNDYNCIILIDLPLTEKERGKL